MLVVLSMIKRLFRSEADLANLSNRRVVLPTEKDMFDYRGLVVNKPWGYEYLLFENNHVAIWTLHITKDHGTSLHCHPQKRTSLIVLSGTVLVSGLIDQFTLNEKDALTIESGVFHSTKALSDDVILIEVETPPNKSDLVRLKDEYGRQNKGYEGQTEMSRELDKYSYHFFDHQHYKDASVLGQKKINNLNLLVKRVSMLSEFAELQQHHENLVCLLEKIPGNELPVGDIIMTGELSKQFSINQEVPSTLLLLLII